MRLIQDILAEWAYRVPDGMPKVSNAYHLVVLEDVLHEKKLPREAIEILLSKLTFFVLPTEQCVNNVKLVNIMITLNNFISFSIHSFTSY